MDTASLFVVWGTIAILVIVTLLAAIAQAGVDADVDAATGDRGDADRVPIRLSWSTGPRAMSDDDGAAAVATR